MQSLDGRVSTDKQSGRAVDSRVLRM
jgi:hypothetical protein